MRASGSNIGDTLKSFIIIQNLLTALAIPFLAFIVGISAFPGVYAFYKILDITNTNPGTFLSSNIDSIPLEDLAITGIATGMAICLLYTSPSPRD